MKIVVVSQYFYPEEFKINDLVEEWVKQGHHITVLTGKPNYPQGTFYSGYKFSGIQKEKYKGAKVIRVPVIRRGKGSSIRLILNYLSFVVFGCWYVLFHKLDADAIFCFGLSPIMQAYPALLLKKMNHSKASIWVQDLWPESVAAVGAVKREGLIWKALSQMVISIYKRCDTIFVQSTAFKTSICKKGNFEQKIIYAPNWAEDLYVKNAREIEKFETLIPSGFVVMFAGNVGAAQNFDSIIKAAELTKSISDIKWVIVGDGRMRKATEEEVQRRGLGTTIKFLGRFNSIEMPNFFVHADVMLVSLKQEDIFALTIPSKIQTYMASGKPIVSMLDGVGNDIIENANCGLTAAAGDYKTLADNVIRLYNTPKADLRSMGVNAKSYYHQHFEKSGVIKTIVDHLL